MSLELRKTAVCCEGSATAAAYENAYYLKAHGPEMIGVRIREIGNDIYDLCTVSYSSDHGATWSDPQPYQVSWQTPAGMVRKGYGIPVADPRSGRLVTLDTTSVLPSDHMLEALTYSFPTYRVSEDGGITWLFEDRIIQGHGAEAYTADHPLQSVWTGKNAVHYANMPFFAADGTLIVPVQITRLQPDGTIFCPPGALSFHEMMVLRGSMQPDGRISWEAGEKVMLEPEVSTRGAIEGAVAEMDDGRFLMVMRGSNAGNPDLPGRKWFCTSVNGCRRWSEVRPWGYSDATPFHSPSSYSTILRHSSGGLYWFGNICEGNPDGNGPDYPVVVGEIDRDSLLLRKDTVCEIDTTRDDDPAPMHLRNFSVYEERSTGDLIIRMTRLWVDEAGHMRGDAYRYRIGV